MKLRINKSNPKVMKIKSIFLLKALLVLTICTTAFIQPVKEIQNSHEISPTTIHPKIKNAAFAKFLDHFEEVEAPFGIGLEEMNTYLAKKEMGGSKLDWKKKSPSKELKPFIPELESFGYSRMGPPSIEPLVWFPLDNGNIAAIYMSYFPFRYASAADFKLMVYNRRGKPVISENNEGVIYNRSFTLAYSAYHSVSSFSINSQGEVFQNNYEPTWKKDIQKYGFDNNQVVDYKLVSTQYFQIEKEGGITKEDICIIYDRASID